MALEEEEEEGKKEMEQVVLTSGIGKRRGRRRKWEIKMERSNVLLLNTLAALIIHLLCDNLNAQAVSDQEARQRFLEEPKDSVALLGQTARFTCLVSNARGSIGWRRGDYALTDMSILRRYSSSLEERVAELPEQLPISNATLSINNVTLQDESDFRCSVADNPPLFSRKARLTVYKAPADIRILLRQSPDEPSMEIPVQQSGQRSIKVRENQRIALECRSDWSKPRAQLVWLDENRKRQLQRHELTALAEVADANSNNSNQDVSNGTSTADSGSLIEQTVITTKSDHLEVTLLLWTFTVKRSHSGKVLTCAGQHAAFEEPVQIAHLAGKELRDQVQLDVLYPPEIHLTKDQLHAYENKPITFHCQAEAKPNELTYRWFIDDQLVEGANEPELRINQLTRQLHLREIKCEVTNAVDSSSATLRLAVLYGPAFVTHLLPASLQPASLDTTNQLDNLASQIVSGKQQKEARSQLGQDELMIANQLAQGYRIGDNINLRCDFDGNPRIQRVEWFKIASDYSILSGVTPQEADELIISGAAHAIFRSGLSNNEDLTNSVLSKTAKTLIDYEQMSAELLNEIALYESQERGDEVKKVGGQIMVKISEKPPTQTIVRISETLTWLLEQVVVKYTFNNNNQEEKQPLDGVVLRPTTNKQLHLLDEIDTLRNSTSQQLLKREAQVSSSVIQISGATEEALGRYVCRAKPSNGSASFVPFARAVFLVPKEQPRIVSTSEQWAPLGSQRVQIECLVQVNTIIDNLTSISWSKDGKLITETETSKRDPDERNVSILFERSPDLLFLRSILRINLADYYDFGIYNCSVTNSKGSDSMPINFQPSAPTGFLFAVMATMAIGSVLILFCVVSLLIVCTPRHKLDAKTLSLSTKTIHSSDARSDSGSLSSGQKSAHSTETQEVAAPTGADHVHCDMRTQTSLSRLDKLDSGRHYEHGYMSDSTIRNSHHHLPTSNSNRNSLRRTANRSGNFAAIHENLENKLQFNGAPLAAARMSQSEREIEQQRQQVVEAEQQTEVSVLSQAVCELDRGSLVNRLWSKLMMKTEEENGKRRVKSRPIISMPVSVSHSRSAAMKRGSLSNSLSILGVNSKTNGLNTAEPIKGNSVNLNHINGGHLVSSSANLIQDSTTASDGTASSSRSSSSNGQNNGINRLVYQPSFMQQSMWMEQQQQSPNSNIQQPDSGSLDCKLYVNNSVYHHQMDPHSTYSNGNCPAPLNADYATATSQTWIEPLDQNIGHYQHPMLTNDGSYYPAQANGNQQPCYSTVCTNQINQQSIDNCSMPIRSPSIQCHQMVPTSDGGEAYFESNYGTLLSRSYRTLGYTNSSPQQHQQQLGSLSDASSSPNSLTTHTTNNLPMSNQDSRRTRAPINGDTTMLQLNDSQAILVNSDGSTIAATNLNGNSLATHV